MQRRLISSLAVLALLALGNNVKAQQPISPRPDVASEAEVEKREQSKRILGVMPQFSVTDRHNPPPLTTGQKFHLFVRSNADPFNFAILGVQAGISQSSNTFPEYGQGASGFFKRYGAALADSTSSGLFSNFVYPTMFKADPRYFRLGKGSFKRRLAYSLAQEFVCHTDKGGKMFHFSNALGALTAGGISNAYYPAADRGLGLTMSRTGIALMYGSLGGLLNEFWPDLERKVLKKKNSNEEKE
jgi:hypothetical protein